MTEPKRIEALYGPFAGQQIDLPAADADQAISDGWARDPFARPSDKPVDPLTQEKLDAAIVAAEKAARKLRGEPEPKKKAAGKPAEKEATRTSTADTQEGGGYKTRTTRSDTKE